MPYTFGSWLSEASPDERRQLQDASVGVLAALHSIDAASPDLAFVAFDLPGDTPLRRHFENQRRYYEWSRGERQHPIIESAFAWLDSRSMNRVQLFAVTDDGAEYLVPSNYFLGLSVTFAQNRLVWPAEGAVPTNTWGVSRDRDIMERGLACNWTADDLSERVVPFSVPQAQIAYFIQRYHQQVLSMLDADGRFEYDLFPHHIFSMPWSSRRSTSRPWPRAGSNRRTNCAFWPGTWTAASRSASSTQSTICGPRG